MTDVLHLLAGLADTLREQAADEEKRELNVLPRDTGPGVIKPGLRPRVNDGGLRYVGSVESKPYLKGSVTLLVFIVSLDRMGGGLLGGHDMLVRRPFNLEISIRRRSVRDVLSIFDHLLFHFVGFLAHLSVSFIVENLGSLRRDYITSSFASCLFRSSFLCGLL
jgi:hypothetical protein